MTTRLVAATNNKKKLIELRRILVPMGFEVLSLADMGLDIEVDENAETFAGNARLKAQAVFERCGLMTVSDDSGLCVDALDGAPGVYSARYGGLKTDEQRNEKLLDAMKNVPAEKRGARFVSAVCCIVDADTMLECEGECRGSIGFAPEGSGGFGYDPLFVVNGRSYSQLTDEEKDRISHRGAALERLRELLRPYMPNRDEEKTEEEK